MSDWNAGPAALDARLRGALGPVPLDLGEAPLGDHAIAGLPVPGALIAAARPAAVLVGLVDRPFGPAIILTERAGHLRRHAGQVALPGGRIDEGEAAQAAALREAREEIGLEPSLVTPLGFLPPYFSGTGFRVEPLVARVHAEARLVPDPAEVARVFELPLGIALDPARYQLHARDVQGKMRRFFVIDYPEEPGAQIWGVTAGILHRLATTFGGAAWVDLP